MLFKKVTMSKEVWILEVKGHEIPMESLKILLLGPLLTIILIVNAAQVGALFGVETVKFTSFMANTGICDPYTAMCTKCYPIANGTKVDWDCKNVTKIDGLLKTTTYNISGG